MQTPDIILVANSPGELSSMVKPVAETLEDKIQNKRIILVLTPCQYTSGKELEYIKTIRGISEVITANDYKNWLLRNRKPPVQFNKKGIVIYLGGDLAHAVLVAKKVNYPAFAYVQDRIAWSKFYQEFYAPDKQSKKKLAKGKKLEEKVKIIGNLMVDSVTSLSPWSPEKNTLTFMPGSRDWQIKHMTPIYKKIINILKTKMPELKFQLVNSPFEKAINIDGAKRINFEDAHNSELVITIPGTNTARLAARGIPMLVVFPLDDPDVIPLEGLPHYIGMIPYFGSKFKRFLADTLNRRIKFFALPNIKAGKEITPEIRGIIKEEEIANGVISLLKNNQTRRKMSQDLKTAMGTPGAAAKIAEEINETLSKTA